MVLPLANMIEAAYIALQHLFPAQNVKSLVKALIAMSPACLPLGLGLEGYQVDAFTGNQGHLRHSCSYFFPGYQFRIPKPND